MVLIHLAVGGDSFQSVLTILITGLLGRPKTQPPRLVLPLISRLLPDLTFPLLLQHLSLIDEICFCHLFVPFACSSLNLSAHITAIFFCLSLLFFLPSFPRSCFFVFFHLSTYHTIIPTNSL